MAERHTLDTLVARLRAAGVLPVEWEKALRAAPRHLFLPGRVWGEAIGSDGRDDDREHEYNRDLDEDAWLDAAYRDTPLTTQWDDTPGRAYRPGARSSSSSSMPTIVFGMLQALDVRDGHRILEIGTGTGWNAALLAARLGPSAVTSIEVDPVVAAQAAANLDGAGSTPRLIVGDGTVEPPGERFDRVIATCAVYDVPPAWLAHTRPDGTIVVPWCPLFGGSGHVRLRVDERGSATGRFVAPSAFMRARGQRFFRPSHHLYLTSPWPADADRSDSTVSPADVVNEWAGQFAVGVQLPGVWWSRETWNGGFTMWVYDAAVSSWASVDCWDDGRSAHEVYQSGPRRLWDEVVHAHAWWIAQGRPDVTEFALSVAPDGAQVVSHPRTGSTWTVSPARSAIEWGSHRRPEPA